MVGKIIQLDILIDRGSTATWNTAGDNYLPAATSPTSVKLKTPGSFRGKEFEFSVAIPSSYRATNTYVEIYSIEAYGTVEERL